MTGLDLALSAHAAPPFGPDELRRAAVLLANEKSSRKRKVQVVADMTMIAEFAGAHHRWRAFRLRGDDLENRLALALHRLVVRLARHDGFGAPANPVDVAMAEDRVRRRLHAERPADPDFWDLSQDVPAGRA